MGEVSGVILYVIDASLKSMQAVIGSQWSSRSRGVTDEMKVDDDLEGQLEPLSSERADVCSIVWSPYATQNRIRIVQT